MQNKNPTITNGVVITSYVESPRTRSIKPSDDPTKKTKPHPRFRISQTARSQGYDHRAQLLAYSRQLRENARSHKNVQVQFPQNQSNPKGQKRLLLAEPVPVYSPLTQILSSSSTQFGCDECVEHKGREVTNRSKKRMGNGNKCCKVLRKLKSMFKRLSCKVIEW
ncbi:hypothetical protein AAZX31_14G154800 [Glycine max]|nr:hypothetical protein JHK82_040235 [Glycine max]KAH1094899.1 hypothetical protein GYH30_040274 [Glycine max]